VDDDDKVDDEELADDDDKVDDEELMIRRT